MLGRVRRYNRPFLHAPNPHDPTSTLAHTVTGDYASPVRWLRPFLVALVALVSDAAIMEWNLSVPDAGWPERKLKSLRKSLRSGVLSRV